MKDIEGTAYTLIAYSKALRCKVRLVIWQMPNGKKKLFFSTDTSWLYELPQWSEILSAETRTELYKKQKASGTVRREGHKIYPNDPCPCGSGKKYKKCCGRNA